MSSLKKVVQRFMAERGFKNRRGFWKFLPDTSLLVEVSLSPMKLAFGTGEKLGHTLHINAYYPIADRFVLVSPGDLANLRKDGTVRHVVYVSETDGVFTDTDATALESVLQQRFDFWYGKFTDPEQALEIILALRDRAPLPEYLAYLSEYIAIDDAQKLRFAAEQEACIFRFDGGVNFSSYVAYLNAGGRFSEARRLIEESRDKAFFCGKPHASVALQGALQKMARDAAEETIVLSEANRLDIARWTQ
jgi:hypothetical protein